MRADQMQHSAREIVALLEKSQILATVRQCRSASSNEKKQASLARLGHAGALLMESGESLSAQSRSLLKCLHLDPLMTPSYWRGVLSEDIDNASRQAELVRLFSRVLFASNHLPDLLNLLDTTDAAAPAIVPLAEGEQAMTIRLSDAGEKASDPDRLARAIDGIDMLYSACASLARKPAMDLQLLNVSGNEHRDIGFLGDTEAVQAVKIIIESIPDALIDIDPEQDIDIQQLVQSLPVFEDLKVLQKLGTYTPSDLQDIRDTMHQGVLLTLESGVILVYDDEIGQGYEERDNAGPANRKPAAIKAVPSAVSGADAATPFVPVLQKSDNDSGNKPGAAGSKLHVATAPRAVQSTSSEKEPGKDEYYDQYLKERERSQSGAPADDLLDTENNGDKRDSAINNLLKGLKK